MSRHLKLIAAVAVVLVAVSGFSPNRKGGGRSHGGGCSSSNSSSHSNSDSTYNDDNDYDSGSGYRSGSRTNHSNSGDSSPTGTVVRCAAQEGSDATAVVSVLNHDDDVQSYTVKVNFRDSSSTLVDSGEAQVTVAGDGSQNVDVRMEHPDRVAEVAECEVASVR
jgi:hypothetical protein